MESNFFEQLYLYQDKFEQFKKLVLSWQKSDFEKKKEISTIIVFFRTIFFL